MVQLGNRKLHLALKQVDSQRRRIHPVQLDVQLKQFNKINSIIDVFNSDYDANNRFLKHLTFR